MTADVTIASWNLHWGRGHKRRRFPPFDVVEGCKRLDADVLALQECWVPDDDPGAAQHVEVARALGYEVAVSLPLARAVAGHHPRVLGRADGDRRRGTGDWSIALLTRLPVRHTSTTRLPQLRLDPCNRAVVHADVVVGRATLAVHTTHLAHLEVGSLLQVRALRRALTPADRPGVLVGDMNMWTPWIGALAPPGWRVRGRGRTYPAHRPHSRLDHLLHTRSVRVDHVEVVPDRGSDHLPIRARLELLQ